MKKIVVVCLALLMVSCTPKLRLYPGYYSTLSPWPYYRGDVQARGVWPAGDFNGKLNLLWEDKLTNKPAAPMTMYHGSLIIPTTAKRIHFFNTSSGKSMGQVKLSGTGQTAVILRDSLLYIALAPNKNRMEAIKLGTNKAVWKTPVKDAAPTPIIVNDRLIISSGDGHLLAINPENGHRLWHFAGEGKFVAPLSYGDGRIFQPADDGTLFAVSESDGKELYRVKLDGPLVSAAAITNIVFIATTKGHVYGLKPEDGSILWQTQLAGPVWGAPAVTDDAVIVGHSAGEVVALNRLDGSQLWHFSAIEVIKASPLVVGQYVVVGSMGGKLWVLRLEDGQPVAHQDVVGAIAYPPVTDGARVYVATQSGRLLCYGEPHEQLDPKRQ